MPIVKSILVCLSLIITTSCATTGTTAEPGIKYGMSPDQVVSIIKEKNEIIEVTKDRVVAIGIWEVLGDKRKKVFLFSDNKLVATSFEPLGR